MRLVYFGSADFAVPALEAVAPHVVLVVTQPDKPSGRGMKLRTTPVKAKALELGLPVESPAKSRAPEFVERIRSLEADALLVAAYGQILSVDLLNSAKQGGINLHGSILPRWRGAAPIQRAIEAGDTVSGVTLMQMDKGMDTGDIIAIEEVAIGSEETAGELFDRLAQTAGEMAKEWLPRIAAGDYPRAKQDDSQATIAPKITREDTLLTFEMDAAQAYNKFRAYAPWPGTTLETNAGPLKLVQVTHEPDPEARPGLVREVKPDLAVGFSGGWLILREVQPQGRRAVSGTDFANGARLRPGMSLS